jgi:hypothetical protein
MFEPDQNLFGRDVRVFQDCQEDLFAELWFRDCVISKNLSEKEMG